MNRAASNQGLAVTDQNITFWNPKDKITLSGTLSIPISSKKPPVVILIAGVGPYDRDCIQMNGQKMFLTIAEHLTKHGIAVLRYDKRGVGQSSGVFDTASTFDFTRDVQAAVEFLKQRSDIDTQNIGLIGHSEGGLISFIVASQSPNITFMVSMAGAIITEIDDLLLQAKLLFKASGAPDEFIEFDKIIRKQILEAIITLSPKEAEKKLLALVKSYVYSMTDEQKRVANTLLPFALTEENYEQWIFIFNAIWRPILLSNPMDIITKVTIPVLAINGALDFIIPATIALTSIKQGLSKNKDATVVAIPNQNHCFQNCRTGALREYIEIQEEFDTSTLTLIADWILTRTSIN